MRKQLTVLQRAAEWVMDKKVFLTTGLTLPDIMLWTEHLILGTHIGQIADVGAWARGDQLNRIRAEVRDLAIKKQWTRAAWLSIVRQTDRSTGQALIRYALNTGAGQVMYISSTNMMGI